MKKLGIVLLLLATTSALAFGGGSSGRTSSAYKRGLNALGIHVGGDKQADIKFKCDDPNSHVADTGICECNDGYLPDSENVCIPNQCTDFTPTECITDCDPLTGNKTYAETCHNDEYYCNNAHECVNPCDEATYDQECQTCTPQGQSADIQNKEGTCGTGGAHICQAGVCIDPCSIGEHPTDNCTPSWHAENGECVPDYTDTGVTCGDNRVCNANHECVCDDQHEDVGGTCMEKCVNGLPRVNGECQPAPCGNATCPVEAVCENDKCVLHYTNWNDEPDSVICNPGQQFLCYIGGYQDGYCGYTGKSGYGEICKYYDHNTCCDGVVHKTGTGEAYERNNICPRDICCPVGSSLYCEWESGYNWIYDQQTDTYLCTKVACCPSGVSYIGRTTSDCSPSSTAHVYVTHINHMTGEPDSYGFCEGESMDAPNDHTNGICCDLDKDGTSEYTHPIPIYSDRMDDDIPDLMSITCGPSWANSAYYDSQYGAEHLQFCSGNVVIDPNYGSLTCE